MKSLSKILATVVIAAIPAIAADAAALEAEFKKLDTDMDGTLSLVEFKASPEGVKDAEKAEAKFKKLDKDTDGTLSLEEYKAQ